MSQETENTEPVPQTAWQKASKYIAEFNPWHNVSVMGTNIGPDILAGLTVAVISLPLALAFGVTSGLGAETGMWGAICGCILVGIFGGSKVGISGPTGPKVVQLAAIVSLTMLPSGEPDLDFIFSLVFLSGVVCLALAFLRVGKFIYYVPYSAVSGFMCGIGAIIILLEIPPMLGFATPNSVVEAIKQIPYDVMHENPHALLVSMSTFVTILVWPKISPVKWIPGPLMGLFVGTTIANAASLNVVYMNEMPTGIPHIYWPNLGIFISRFGEMIGPACALAGLCIFDSLLTCLVADNMSDERHSSDREIFGQGVANLACGLVGGVTTATATMRTVANIKCGAKTGLASVVAGLVLLSFMMGLGPLASYIPMACLAGILLKVGIDILDYRVLPVLHRMPAADAVCFWAVLGLTISVDLLVAMGVGIAIAFIRAIHELGNLYDPEVISLDEFTYKWPGEENFPEDLKKRTLKLRLDGPLFFGAADTVYRTISELVDYDYLIIRMKNVPMIDLSGAYLLDDVVEKAKHQGAEVLITGMRPNVQQTLEKLKIIEKVGPDNCFVHIEEAASRIEELDQKRAENVSDAKPSPTVVA